LPGAALGLSTSRSGASIPITAEKSRCWDKNPQASLAVCLPDCNMASQTLTHCAAGTSDSGQAIVSASRPPNDATIGSRPSLQYGSALHPRFAVSQGPELELRRRCAVARGRARLGQSTGVAGPQSSGATRQWCRPRSGGAGVAGGHGVIRSHAHRSGLDSAV